MIMENLKNFIVGGFVGYSVLLPIVFVVTIFIMPMESLVNNLLLILVLPFVGAELFAFVNAGTGGVLLSKKEQNE